MHQYTEFTIPVFYLVNNSDLKPLQCNVWFKFVVVRTPLGIISLFPFCKIHMHVKSENPAGGMYDISFHC